MKPVKQASTPYKQKEVLKSGADATVVFITRTEVPFGALKPDPNPFNLKKNLPLAKNYCNCLLKNKNLKKDNLSS